MPITLSIDTALCNPSATVHVPIARRDRHVAILYLHGGGLLYGDRDDLPEPYRNLLLDAGYTLYCLDYPLAPRQRSIRYAQASWKRCAGLPNGK